MLISYRKKFIFFHLPKAAGSSIEGALRKYSHIPSTRLYNYMIDYLGERPALNLFERHIRPERLKSFKPMLFDGAFYKFAVVRNTWDWHCSQYYFHKNTKGTVFHEGLKDMNFSEYVEWATLEDNIQRANSRQKRYLSDNQGNLLVDKVLMFNQLASEFSVLCRELGAVANLQVKNKSQRNRSYRENYSQKDKLKIEKAHQEDIDFFGFSF